MPFASEFNDVYATIKASVEGASGENSLRCFRLDESRPAGRITDRLIREIQAASLCIADLTGAKPNVMWEVGYAMALGKPTIIITQENDELPFDVRVMETIHYDRKHWKAPGSIATVEPTFTPA
jgi:nucleoside 2-deoxyribosyltransferase